MKKKMIIVVLIIVVIIFCTGCASYSYDIYEVESTKDEKLCAEEGCMELHMHMKKYCINHNCLYQENTIYVCEDRREDGQKYCWYHSSISVEYSDAEKKEAKKMAQEYCNELVSRHDDITNIYGIGEGHDEIGDLYFYCNLVINDSIKSARVVIYKPDYENMKVLGLEFKDGDDWKWYTETR